MPIVTVPGRNGVEPDLALIYDSAGDDSVLGVGFSLAKLSAITRCPSNLADGQIRGVRYDAEDKLCLDNKPLVPVKREPGRIEYRTLPDTFTKVVGHYPQDADAPESALFFEAYTPSGLVIEYGSSDSSKPRARGGVPSAWLAAKTHDGRGSTMTYSYCSAESAEGDGYTAEVALDEIRYTGFDGSPALPPSRAVQLFYGPKDPADVRVVYSGGMALQRSLRLEQIQMLGPEESLVRRYAFTYGLSETTQRTLLAQVEECAGDGVYKPPTRFQFSDNPAGFKQVETPVPIPFSPRASPMLFDVEGDGLDDLVLPDTNPALSTAGNPITDWWVARNQGPSSTAPPLAPAALAFSQQGVIGAELEVEQPELGTSLDYNQDGRTDVLLHDVQGTTPTWQVLLAQPDRTFRIHDTGIDRPFPLHVSPTPPGLTSDGGSMHLADLDGTGVPDLIQCRDHGETLDGDPSKPVWTVHLWQPARDTAPAGFEPAGEPLAPLAGFRCDAEVYTLDLDADGKVNLLLPAMLRSGDGSMTPASTYSALSRRSDGSWEVVDTRLHQAPPGGRVVFLDVNGDGLPDAVQSGFQDHRLRTFVNTGPTFAAVPEYSLPVSAIGAIEQDLFFRLAVVLDANGDSKQDLLMPVPPGTPPNPSNVLPAWAVLQATGAWNGPTFALVDPHIPFAAKLGDAITLADRHAPRIGDINGDGAQDVVLPVGGVYQIFENLAHDQDLLVAVSDGMNAHDPSDPDFVPDVSIAYGHLTDAGITSGAAPGDPAWERALYLKQDDTANDCAYPRTCVVGPRRVVSSYATNNGADQLRHFGVRYRDGRYHHLGLGFLSFGERIVTDLDTGAGTAERYDNITYVDTGGIQAFPFAGQVQHQGRWYPGLLSQPEPDKIELSFTDVTWTVVPTNESTTYFTLPTERRVRRAQGHLRGPVEAYVQQVESSGGGATVLRDTVTTVSDFDSFGNVRIENVSTTGVDLTFHVERTFENDTDRWVLGQLQTQKECSTAAGRSQCRTLTRTTTVYGEVETEATASDDGSPDTKLQLVYSRDAFGNLTGITADDAYGHHRVSSTTYDPEGIYPETHTNAADHTVLTEFDAGLGVLTKWTDPNQLVTRWAVDGFGRPGLETRPDGTQTTVTLSRDKGGGPGRDAWRVLQRSTTTGGADDTVEVDSRGRPVRAWWHGPTPPGAAGEPPRLMRKIEYDPTGELVARRSVPVREDTPDDKLLFDVMEHDALGREVRHTTPWHAVVKTSFDASRVEVTDALEHVTVAEHDPLGRPVTITDAALGVTEYTYGPFGMLETATDPGGALTRTTRDAFGRVTQLDDPDRGTTVSHHDGFGDLISSTDALGREITFEVDGLGRPTSRLDRHGAERLTTTWTWDTAEHGIGKLHAVTSPDGKKAYTYTGFGQLETLALAIEGEGDSFQARLGYDPLGRVATITYPTPTGAAPFVVAQDYDAYGHVHTVRDSATSFPYWRLTEVDNAGRFQKEVFGNDVSTVRGYFADKQRVKSIVTRRDAATVQNLAYDYDARLDLASRTDALQPQHRTERFRYDPLERLTCAYFSVIEDDAAPCALGYGHDPDGNLTFKSDAGTLFYDDPAHPHAVTGAGAGGDRFGYNAVGNQISRPGGVTVTYTPFDLPESITESALRAVTFGYDGDQQRIRKTTPDQETLYLGELYERVTHAVSAVTEHRYYVRSPERVVAVVTRGGAQPGTRYLHVDHLGSVDALTGEDGGEKERRSYDPFGQRRNPIWGQPAPASFSSLTTQGFTGHEDDDELGLVNMRGRIFDPKVGRFLTTDPLVSAPLSGQGWNNYSYVRNNPLNAVDPTGFEDEPNKPPIQPIREVHGAEGGLTTIGLFYSPRVEGPRESVEVGPTTTPVDVGTTGSASGYVPQPVTTAPTDWIQNPRVQLEGGFLSGLLLGRVPFAGVGQQLLDAAEVLPHGTPEARLGLAIGQIVGGFALAAGGLGGEVLGGIASATGIGAVLGMPAIAVSAGLVVGGAGNMAAGIRGLSQALMSTGSGSTGPQGKAPAAGATTDGPRAGKSFTLKGKSEIDAANAANNGGVNKCTNCGTDVVPGQKSQRGVSPPSNQRERDHIIPRSKGGNGLPDNGQVLCRDCNLNKSDTMP